MVTETDDNAQEMFNQLMRVEVAPMLRTHGCKGSGKDYKRVSGLYRAVINFQKSTWNTKDEVEFTVNLGVVSDEAVSEWQEASARAYERWGHDAIVIPTWGSWSTRIGHLLPYRYDKWCRLVTGRSPERTRAEVLTALSEFALPAIERQTNKSRVEPSYVIETRGNPCGWHVLENGDHRWHNVGGQRLYPLDTLDDAVDREYVSPSWEATQVASIPVDFRVTQQDGILSLELDQTRRHLAEEDRQLTEGMQLSLYQWWVDPKGNRRVFNLAGEAHWDEVWGWGADVSPRGLRGHLDAAEKLGYTPAPS